MYSLDFYLKDYINCSGHHGGFVDAKRLRNAGISRGNNLSYEPNAKYWCHRNCLYYLYSMFKLPDPVLNEFMKAIMSCAINRVSGMGCGRISIRVNFYEIRP